MNHLLAKTKGKKGNFYKVLSNKTIFSTPDDLKNAKEYDANYKLEDDEWFLISASPKLVADKPIIIINNSADGIYDKDEDIFYFKKLTSVSGIFKGIEVLYREATNDETETFLKNDFIKLEDGYDADSVKTANRKRIAMAMDTLNKFSKDEKKQVFSY